MKVSIIVPVFNCQMYIDRCLDSLRKQSYSNVEIIIVNDGSTDNTLELVTYHSDLDSRINVLNQANSGTYLARMNGIKVSTGEVILNVDSDDYLELNAVQLLVDEMLSTNADIVLANYYQHRNGIKRLMKNTIPIKDNKIEAIKFMLLGEISIYIWGRLFKRYLFEKIELPLKRPYTEDVLTNFYILCNHNVKLALVEEPVLNYVIHTSNISYSKNQDPVEGFYNEFEIVEKMLAQKDLDSVLQEEIALYKSIMWIGYCRKGGLKTKEYNYHKRFFRENYPKAKKFLPIHFKLEMYIYSKSLWLGKQFTNLIFWVYKHLVGIGVLKIN